MERNQNSSWLRNWRILILCGGALFAGFLLGMLIFGSPWHLPPAWGDIPTWITAVATAGLLAGAIITAWYAIKTFNTQADQLARLVEENDRQADERRRAQAARVFTEVPQGGVLQVRPAAMNASDFPVYDAQFWFRVGSALVGPEDFGMIMPHSHADSDRVMNTDDAHAGTILAFRDADGICWIRMPGGALDEQAHDTARESVLAALGQPQPEAPEVS